jgi:hypothetical protein
MPIILADQLNPEDLESYEPGRVALASSGRKTFVISTVTPDFGAEYGLIVTELRANGALIGTEVFGTEDESALSGIRFGSGALATFSPGGETYVYVPGEIEGREFGPGTMTVLKLSGAGVPSVVESFEWQGASINPVAQNLPDPKILSVGDTDFLIQPHSHGDELTAFEIGADGGLTERGTIELANGGASYAMTVVERNGMAFVVAKDFYAKAPLSVFSLDEAGDFAEVFNSDLDEPLLYNRIINDATVATIGRRTFVFTSENTHGTIAVQEMSANGHLQTVGYESAHVGTDDWRMPHSLDTFQLRGETFLVAGGNASTLVVFAVSGEGGLVEVAEHELTDFGSRRINNLEATVIDGKALIVAANQTEAAIQSFRFTPGAYEIATGRGNNSINGRVRDDLIRSGSGNDKVDGKAGDDLVEGGSGRDSLKGGLGDDDLYGGGSADRLSGMDGNDWLFGGAGGDRLSGGVGTDFLRGQGDNDRIAGGDGNDRLFGDGGTDRLSGGAGEDVIEDGAGRDRLAGGSFGDVFVLVDDGARDRITDFENGSDLIDLTAEGETLIFPDIRIQKSGKGLLLSYGDDSIVLAPASGSLRVTDIGLDDFLLA